jgi:hypothetical protein
MQISPASAVWQPRSWWSLAAGIGISWVSQGKRSFWLEVGDPLEGEANYGGYPYTLNGFTYNLQDLVFLQYFGQVPSTSVNGWWSFQNANLSVCSNGQ